MEGQRRRHRSKKRKAKSLLRKLFYWVLLPILGSVVFIKLILFYTGAN